jgi:hypothetical protein
MGLVLVPHIHTHLVLVVCINNYWYIKFLLVYSRKRCGICSTCISTLIAWILSHSQLCKYLPLRGWIIGIMVIGDLSIKSKLSNPVFTAPLQQYHANMVFFTTVSSLGNCSNCFFYVPDSFDPIEQESTNRDWIVMELFMLTLIEHVWYMKCKCRIQW